MLIRVLLAVEPLPLRRRLARLLDRGRNVAVEACPRGELWQRLNQADIDLVLVGRDLLPTAIAEWITSVRNLPERPEVVVLSQHDDPQARAALLTAGCIAALDAGLADRELGEAMAAVVDRRRAEALRLLRAERREERPSLQDFVSKSLAMRQFLPIVRRVAESDSTMLILGETGTGKERLARAVHHEGTRAAGPFLAVNCGALPETLLESELFGHEQGAFTGASRSRRGYFELAHGGTLFLDEIGEMPVHLQVKLLRALEERRVRRLGSEKSISVDVRLMAASNRDLDEEVRAKRFRADLFYRLAVVTVAVPPLRERREDIPALVRDYLGHFAVVLGRQVVGIRPEALAALERHDWPGNVRELINVIERAVLLASREEIGPEDLPRSITGLAGPRSAATGPTDPALTFPAEWRERPLVEARRAAATAFTRAYLGELLRGTGGRVGQTARRAGISQRSLYDLMRRHGLNKEDYRS